MKRNKLEAYIKKSGSVVLITDRNEAGEAVRQYVSVGMGCYPIDGLPELNAETLLSVLDLDKDKVSVYTHEMTDYIRELMEDNAAQDQTAEALPMTLGIGGSVLQPIRCGDRLYFVNAEALGVTDDQKKARTFHARMLKKDENIGWLL